jgi:hypothetical protein
MVGTLEGVGYSMTWGTNNWQNNFIETVAQLASSPEAQIAYIRNLGGTVDELALEFDSFFIPDRLALTDQQDTYASEIDRLLDAMSNAAEDALWSFSGLQSDKRWADVREIAASLLFSLTEKP